jgi:flavin reductase (DIM6/NTAB) family NADH-FMN oxidoreductase RutF
MSTDWLTRATQPDTDAAPSMDTSEFKSIFRRHPAGVAVVTLSDLGRPIGFTATSVISVSAEPPLLVFSVSSGSSSWPALARVETLVISFLAASQADVSARFATRGIDRFAAGGWTRLSTGEPVILKASAWLRGEIVQRTAVGSSYLVAVRAVSSQIADPVPPLVFHDRAYHRIDESSAL